MIRRACSYGLQETDVHLGCITRRRVVIADCQPGQTPPTRSSRKPLLATTAFPGIEELDPELRAAAAGFERVGGVEHHFVSQYAGDRQEIALHERTGTSLAFHEQHFAPIARRLNLILVRNVFVDQAGARRPIPVRRAYIIAAAVSKLPFTITFAPGPPGINSSTR